MFGLFSRKPNAPSVTEADKHWIEANIAWFIKVFGLEHLEQSPFILPSSTVFSFNDLSDETQFQNLFKQLCSYWRINPDEIIVKFFDDIKSKQWTTWVYTENASEPAGLFNQMYTTDEKRFKIQLATSTLQNAELLINVISHELGHVKLIGGDFIKANDADMEPLTDLASIFFGFGLFMANTSISSVNNWITRTGYIQSQIISYTNALLCYITDRNCEEYTPYLNSNTKALFINDCAYLQKTNDTLLNRSKVDACLMNYTNNKIISVAFETRKFADAIEASRKLLQLDPKNQALYNSIGYALLLQKKYEEAIIEFTNAIDIDPYWDYPYNNRGYCKLQLNDLDNAFPDLHSSFEMNPTNSFSWRNLGVYYFLLNDFEKALLHFEEAEKIDPKTEMINFYLSRAHSKLNNTDRSLYYAEKSKEKDEYNDSVIE